jgi:hypothetical protein
MDNYIIKGAGTITEICTALKTLSVVFGKNATLDDMRKGVEFGRLMAVERKQWEDIQKGA